MLMSFIYDLKVSSYLEISAVYGSFNDKLGYPFEDLKVSRF